MPLTDAPNRKIGQAWGKCGVFMDRHTQVRNCLNLGIIYGENNIMDDVQDYQMAEHE